MDGLAGDHRPPADDPDGKCGDTTEKQAHLRAEHRICLPRWLRGDCCRVPPTYSATTSRAVTSGTPPFPLSIVNQRRDGSSRVAAPVIRAPESGPSPLCISSLPSIFPPTLR